MNSEELAVEKLVALTAKCFFEDDPEYCFDTDCFAKEALTILDAERPKAEDVIKKLRAEGYMVSRESTKNHDPCENRTAHRYIVTQEAVDALKKIGGFND